MKLTSALLAVLMTAAPVMTHSAEVTPAEPPSTPSGGGLLSGISVADVFNILFPAALLAAIVSGDDDTIIPTSAGTGTGTGTH